MLEQREYFAARLSLTADEVDVMSLEITVEKGYGEFEPIRNETVDVAWLKPGAWIADVLEWRERYESSVQNEVLARKYAPGVIAELKAKYGL